MTHESIHFFLALARMQISNNSLLLATIANLGSVEAFFDIDESTLKQYGFTTSTIRRLKSPEWQDIEQDLEWLNQENNHCISYFDPAYPELLKQISNPPILLFVTGRPEVISRPQLAIVGSRTPTPVGEQNTKEFAKSLSEAGLYITSGMALGVDSLAHRGTLEVGGVTIAVAGTGLDRVYPARNKDLAHEISTNGAIVSEFPIGVGVRAQHFPRRNRIISGMSIGVLVVEAAIKSGSLITARLALEEGRDVLAIPGSIHNPLAKGCHALIKQGAKLVENSTDVIEEIGALACYAVQQNPVKKQENLSNSEPLDDQYKVLLEAMGDEIMSVDSLVNATDFKVDEVASMLLMLELQGFVKSLVGGYMKIHNLLIEID